MHSGIAVREAEADDGDALAGIYNPYIADTTITFEETPVSAVEMAHRVAATLTTVPVKTTCSFK